MLSGVTVAVIGSVGSGSGDGIAASYGPGEGPADPEPLVVDKSGSGDGFSGWIQRLGLVARAPSSSSPVCSSTVCGSLICGSLTCGSLTCVHWSAVSIQDSSPHAELLQGADSEGSTEESSVGSPGRSSRGSSIGEARRRPWPPGDVGWEPLCDEVDGPSGLPSAASAGSWRPMCRCCWIGIAIGAGPSRP